jgi:hypothetical protein
MVAGSMPRASIEGLVMSVRVKPGVAAFTKTTKCCCCVTGDLIWLSNSHASNRVYAFKNTLETRYVAMLMGIVESLNHPSLCIRPPFKSSRYFLARESISSTVRFCTSASFSLNSALPRACVVTILVYSVTYLPLNITWSTITLHLFKMFKTSKTNQSLHNLKFRQTLVKFKYQTLETCKLELSTRALV